MNRLALALAALSLSAGMAASQVPAKGTFTAQKSCPAVQSIKKGTNPGDISVSVGESYRLTGKNKEEATHYLVEVPGAEPAQRWVAAECGSIVTADADAAPSQSDQPFYVLALSWQPAFCEGHAGKPECSSQYPERFDALNFTLHGLWPQPRSKAYCNVDQGFVAADEAGQWQDLPPLELSADVRERLETVMPGTQSFLERHEWIKHGTCYPGASAQRYYEDSLRLTEAINASDVRRLFSKRSGKMLKTAEIQEQFDAAFGQGAGKRIRIACKDDDSRRLIVEMTIGLKGEIGADTPIADLILASSPTDAGCPGGIVDSAGLQ